jgi:hypothetical protein
MRIFSSWVACSGDRQQHGALLAGALVRSDRGVGVPLATIAGDVQPGFFAFARVFRFGAGVVLTSP